jgi:1-acyl-sn-glycerol-3-phosphate acyltransferase
MTRETGSRRQAWRNESDLGHPGVVEPRARQRWLRYVRPLVRLAFRPRFEGVENLPAKGPYLLVSNHSGAGNAEIMSLVIFFLERHETIGPTAAMVHPLSFRAWPHGTWMRRLGAIPSTYAAAEAALAQGVSVLVMPGGDHEAQRPIWQANKVDFAGRKGFLRIAREAKVPIVPMGIRGSHYTAPILWRSDFILPRILIFPALAGMKRYALTLAGAIGVILLAAWNPAQNFWITGLLAWLWLVLPFATLPWIPWPIRVRIGKPLPPEELFADGEDSSLDRAYVRVESAVQALVSGALLQT